MVENVLCCDELLARLIKMKTRQLMLIESDMPPVVEIDHQSGAVYVRFTPRGTKAAKTIVRCEWPHVAVDLDGGGRVIGVEAIGIGEMTIGKVLQHAQIKAKSSIINSARYV